MFNTLTPKAVPGVSNDWVPHIDPRPFHWTVSRMRQFFEKKGFLEVHTQNRLSILAACEDPKTIATFDYAGETWPLPQTGQMWLEWELLTKKNVPGFYCVSTSYRYEPNPTAGRHHWMFPMFEFEMHGGVEELISLESELLEHLGMGDKTAFPGGFYQEIAQGYGVDTLENEHEQGLCEKNGPVFFLRDFPEQTNPFWNMKRYDGRPDMSAKVDVLVHGMETIGSAERSCDPEQMRQGFDTIENGEYAQLLYSKFSKERVEREMDQFLSLDFVPRSGGGIGLTRLMRGLQLSNQLPKTW